MSSADAITEDEQAILALVARQFTSLSWPDGGGPDLKAFAADFHSDAQLFASARPARAQPVQAFAERMKSLATSTLRSFDEQVLGTRMQIFGNVAVAVVACENIENGQDRNRNVEMMLLVKDQGRWRIAAQAWDKERDGCAIPADLLAT